MKTRMSIREIKSTFKVGQEKAQIIQSMYFEKAFNGRKPISISQDEIDYVKNYLENFNVGYQRMAGIAQLDTNGPKQLNEWKTRKIYDHEDLYLYSEEYRDQKMHDLRFVARYANQAWHTDLHYLDLLPEENFKQKYLIGFVDDRSRKLIYYEIIDNKEAETTSRALMNALKFNQKPKTLIVDNGKEFTADCFIETLNQFGIELHNVHPYTPQENGKVERFWYTIERARTRSLRGSYLRSIIEQYNKYWIHGGLKEITNQDLTPEKAWNTMEHYNGQDDADYVYY